MRPRSAGVPAFLKAQLLHLFAHQNVCFSKFDVSGLNWSDRYRIANIPDFS